LKKLTESIRNELKYKNYLQVSNLCKSLGGADIKMMTITENVELCLNYYDHLTLKSRLPANEKHIIKYGIDTMKKLELARETKKAKKDTRARLKEQFHKEVGIETRFRTHLMVNAHKKAMVITSRVHPGETQSSYALEGMLKFLLSDCKEARQLRRQFIFYVVPMLNPDGVIHGNHRTDLLGFDMNRRWSDPSPWIHPTMYAMRNFVSLIQDERKIEVFCDIHGHFQPCGGFMYCNTYDKE